MTVPVSSPETVHEVDYETVMRRFRAAFRMEHLPTKPVPSARWFASEFACGALVPYGKSGLRIKGTVTLPEYRGMGYGLTVIERLIEEATASGAAEVEVFARHPGLFLRLGFEERRTTSWGTTVLRRRLAP